MDGSVVLTESTELPKKGEKTALELQKHALKESAERWRERIKKDPDLQYLDGVRRLQKDFPAKQISAKPRTVDIGKGLDHFYSYASVTSPQSKVSQIDLNEFEHITTTTPRLTIPTRATARGRSRRNVSYQPLLPSICQPIVGTLSIPIDYRSKIDQGDDRMGISNSAKKGLQSKVNYSAVKLKKRELKSPYPELMLIRVKGDKNMDVRLVAPKYTSVHAYAVFILITPKQLFLYHGKYSSLLERSKAAIIVTSICEKNGELGCSAKRFENVHEGVSIDVFWRLLGLDDGECETVTSEEYVPDSLLALSEPFESIAAQVNGIYEVDEHYDVQRISSRQLPKFSFLHPSKNLIFDFGSEIYVWVGRNANRVGTQYAVAYAETLRTKSLNIASGLDRMILGDNFDMIRPTWCLLIKLTQGLNDSLFQHKFHDWQEIILHTYNTPAQCIPSTSPASVLHEEEEAYNLGRNLASQPVEEPVLILEEQKLYRNSKNVFTENIRYFILKGEKTLNEMDELWILRDNRCYIIKWEYRIERIGIRKLDGTEREKETGRLRVAYFYWLGKRTTKTEQGLCALALRDYDEAHFPHERITQGQEPPLFLQLFQGSLIISGCGSGIFLVYGSSIVSEARMEEQTLPIIYRAHAVYIALNDGKITILEGMESNESSKIAAANFAEKIKIHYSAFEQFISEPIIDHCYLTGTEDRPVIKADNWIKPPRLFRLSEKDGEELFSTSYDSSLPFSFQQSSLRDTIMVDQDNRLWLWSDKTISMFALRVANAYWSDRSGPEVVICKTQEPDSFKALFATWDDFIDEIDGNELTTQNPLRWQPVNLDELLQLRTKTWPLEKVTSRDLPPGVDLNRLEQYLNDDDFQSVFRMDRTAFYALPHWKQTVLRKKHKLF
uniref:HP domain-containing protein n=1 Tax=Elaeophora elaphi TaxID=1147741 RepID=A0A0R3RS89_9BILA